ncbi:MAG: hypothetical protein PHV42_00985 [Candidatus Pacebacteria bacterium]|nr:hypothetical protein [Candidatus Paceibacterota bacterium]
MQKIIDDLKEVHLTSSEKSRLLTSLMKKIDEMPKGPFKKRTPSPYFTWFEFSSRKLELVLGAFVILILFGSGVAFAANGSLPGDILYPVKVGVNEKVARIFHSESPASEALFETHLMDERLNEAEKLSQTNKLDNASFKEQVKEGVAAQTNRAEKAVEKADENKTALPETTEMPVQNGLGNEEKTQGNGNATNEKNNSAQNRNRETIATSSKNNAGESADNAGNGAENPNNSIKGVIEKHQKILQELKLDSGESHGLKKGKE